MSGRWKRLRSGRIRLLKTGATGLEPATSGLTVGRRGLPWKADTLADLAAMHEALAGSPLLAEDRFPTELDRMGRGSRNVGPRPSAISSQVVRDLETPDHGISFAVVVDGDLT